MGEHGSSPLQDGRGTFRTDHKQGQRNFPFFSSRPHHALPCPEMSRSLSGNKRWIRMVGTGIHKERLWYLRGEAGSSQMLHIRGSLPLTAKPKSSREEPNEHVMKF